MSATPAVDNVGDPRASHHHNNEHPLEPAAKVIVRGLLEHGRAQDGAEHVRRSSQREGGQCHPCEDIDAAMGLVHRPTHHDNGCSPDEHADRHTESASSNRHDAAGEDPADHGAEGKGGEQQRVHDASFGRLAEVHVGHLGNERAGLTEDHRNEVDDERHQQDGMDPEESKPGEHAGKSCALFSLLPRPVLRPLRNLFGRLRRTIRIGRQVRQLVDCPQRGE